MRTNAEWKACRLDELGYVGRGKSRHRPRNDARLYGGPYPFIQTADIMAADPYITGHAQTYSEFGLQQSKLWPPNTLCVTIAGANTAQTAILKFEACFPDSIVGFVPDEEKADLHFVKYSLDLMKDKFRSVTRGATQDNLSLDKLLSFPLSTPPLPVQRRIAGILSAYDALIENSQRRIRTLEVMARALYREWFGSDTIGAVTGASPPVRSVVGSPHWQLISENVAPYAGTRRYFATADVDGLELIGAGIDYPYSELPSRAKKQPLPLSVWFARMKDTYKVLAFSEVNREMAASCILSSGFVGFCAAQSAYLPYLFLTISSREFHELKNQFCTGATQMSLTNEGLARIGVTAPPEEMIRRFGEKVLPLLHLMLLLQERKGILRRTRDLLLPRLLLGQVAIPEVAE